MNAPDVGRHPPLPSEPLALARGRGWLVAWKPAGALIDADPSLESDTFRAALAAALGLPFAACHPHTRLDRPVAGLTLWSVERETRRKLVDATRRGEVRKLYLALVKCGEGGERGECGECGKGGKCGERGDTVKNGAGEGGVSGAPRQVAHAGPWRTRAGRPLQRAPVTRIAELASSGGTALVAAGITAGKWHQIRMHLAGAGMPILGDRLHGGTPRLVRADGAVLAAPVIALECVGVEVPDDGRKTLVLEPPRGFVRDGATWAGLDEGEFNRAALERAWQAVWGDGRP
ncbi:MAG: RNA pseudouridine synthase [Deltaproteobacteria bacterium]|nr:RNA pseudouridine synthase [Deltaproteobacteria bacterium]